MGMVRAILCLTLVIAVGGCSGTRQDERAGTAAGDKKGSPVAGRQITGTVKHVDLEGGFYGVVTDDGQKLDPVNLPDAFKQDGLRIKARVETSEGRVSVHMWGTPVTIVDIQRAQ